MRKQTYSDKQREEQQRKKQAELWAKMHPKPEEGKPEKPATTPVKSEQPERRTA